MKKTFQSFVFGCRVNEAERAKFDSELIQAGYTVDLASPSFLIINSCAITGKAEREAKQLIYQLRRKYPEAKIVLTGCSATVWEKYSTPDVKLVDLIVPNTQKSSLVNLIQEYKADSVQTPLNHVHGPINDKFRASNRLIVKIQDGCHRFCSYCIVPYLRGLPQSQKIVDIVAYINSFPVVPSEVVLSAINTEAFGKDSGESMINLIKEVLKETKAPRVAFGSVHPWSLTDEYIDYYKKTISQEQRFVQFFHVPLQSGSQEMLGYMRREYKIQDVITKLKMLSQINPNALIATDVIVGFLGETEALFEETYSTLEQSPITRFHVFRFSNRAHTAAYYMQKQLKEPTMEEKKERSNRLISLSKKKYQSFLESQIGRIAQALVIAENKNGTKVLLDNQVEGVIKSTKHCLPGEIVHVTIIAAKDGLVVCKES